MVDSFISVPGFPLCRARRRAPGTRSPPPREGHRGNRDRAQRTRTDENTAIATGVHAARAPPLREPRGGGRRRAAAHLRAVLRPLRPLVGRAAGLRRRQPATASPTIAPNTHAQLEAFYAVPQIGAVLVPINYRLIAERLRLHHQPQRRARRLRALRLPRGGRQHPRPDARRRALRRARRRRARAGSTTRRCSRAAGRLRCGPRSPKTDLLTINYTSGTTARPKGVMITHRNAYVNTVGTLVHVHMTPDDRYLWTLPMFHANGWTFVWTVTAAGGTHVCLRKVERRASSRWSPKKASRCCAPRRRCSSRIANAPEDLRRDAPRGVRVLTAGAPPAAATIERIEGELGWEVTQVYGLTETAPFITICEPLAEHARLPLGERAIDQGAPRRRARDLGRAARRRRGRRRGARTTARRSARSSCAATS